MALFIVRHQHAPERCPAQDPDTGAMLLNHLSRPNVRQYGVQIQGEAVVYGEHTLYLIVEASDEHQLRRFMQPFAQAGSLDIFPASTCARVVASGGCGADLAVSDAVTAVDPEEACQDALDAELVVHRAHPLNCETSIPALLGGVVMPNAHFYVRNHFQIPDLDPHVFRLSVGGLVDRPLSLSLAELRNMKSQTLPLQHGYPVRVIVPGWYAVASVKWLTDIDLIDRPFEGHYQSEKYWYEWERDGGLVREPVTLQDVRALITEPAPNQEAARGNLTVRGVAWSGAAPIARVEVSVGDGSWQTARLVSERRRHSWQWWELITQIEANGPSMTMVRARAFALAGRSQPERAEWNRLGYGNNGIHEVPVHVT